MKYEELIARISKLERNIAILPAGRQYEVTSHKELQIREFCEILGKEITPSMKH